MIKSENLYIDRVLGIQRLSSSVYYDIAVDALQHPDKDVQSWKHFNDYVRHCYRCWGMSEKRAIERLNYYRENLVKKGYKGRVMFYSADDKIHILEGHHRLGLRLAGGKRDDIAYSLDSLDRPWIVILEDPRSLEKLVICAEQIYGLKKLYHKVPVNCFDGWRHERPYDNRLQAIKQECKPSDIRFLDLGCDTGWLDFGMHSPERFFVGVDNSPHAIEMANRLSFILDKPVYFIESDILDFLEHRGKYYFTNYFDVTFFLSAFQHIYRKSPEKAAMILRLISQASKSMFFDSVESTDSTSSAFPSNLKQKFTAEFLRDFVLKNTNFTGCKLLRRDNFLHRHLFYFYH